MRKLATIRQVADIRPIPGADRIEVAQIDGWECVVKKGEFQVDEKIVYIEVDSILPERPEFEFMRERKFRVRTIKLRKQVSQGLVLPLDILPSGENYCPGDDVTEILGIKKYDPQADEELLMAGENGGEKWRWVSSLLLNIPWIRKRFGEKIGKSGYPAWILKTDEERIQNKPAIFDEERKNRTPFMVTEKVDGQSATYFLERKGRWRYEFGVCSRNLRLERPDSSSYWKIAQRLRIKAVLHKIIGSNDRVVLQGEIIGPRIQKNKYKRSTYEFYAFNLIFPGHKCDTKEITQILAPFHIQTVPIVQEEKLLPDSIADLVEYAKGKSVLVEGQQREGVVMRNMERDISFKVINPDFLLADDE